MATNQFHHLLSYIKLCYPKSFDEIQKRDLISPLLFSPFEIRLPQSVNDQVSKFVTEVYKVKDSKEYQNSLDLPKGFCDWPSTPSVLSCFDFHYTEEMGLKLIEINTNASLYLPIILQRCAQGDHCIPPQFDKLFESFVEAFELKKGDGISIFDEAPENEGLYFEFLIFKEWLTQKGFDVNIVSCESYSSEAKENIYNRYTDFYFDNDISKQMKSDYINRTRRFSPNPREYFLMADKKRQMTLKKFLNPAVSGIIPESKLFSEFESKDDIWAQRKKYFFKPSQSFGSKGVYSGRGISRKAFDNLYGPNIMAQENCPAGKRKFKYEGQEVEMKFDLRFFTFNGEIQNYAARIYQGQATNMRTPLGGIAPILWD